VVLVHGSSGGLDSWNPILPLLEDEFEPWVYARRGYPPSEAGQQPKTFADDVADVRAVLAAAGGSAHLVGGSYGATVALHAAATDATPIRSLALFEPPLFAAGAAAKATLGPYSELVDAGDFGAASRLFAEKVARVPASILAALPEPINDPDDTAAKAEAIGCLRDLEAMATDTEDIARWASVSIPVLLLQGGDTWSPMPQTMDALADALPEAAREVLAGQSHFATHTAPQLVAGKLREFLQAQE
jgi:pimeloyl-ACP methyl ester carboxylesterase